MWVSAVATMLVLMCALGASGTAWAQTTVLAEWDRNTDAYTVGYRIFYGPSPGNHPWSEDVGNVTRAPLTLPSGSSYYITVRAYNVNGGLGPASNEATVDLSPPGAPTGVTATSVGSLVTVNWNAPTDRGAASGYLLYVGTASGVWNLLSAYPVGNTLSVSGNLAAGRYYLRVQALNTLGQGPGSAEVSFVVGGTDQPGNPSSLSASWQGTVVTLNWNPGVGASSSLVEAGTAAGASNIGTINVGAATRYSVDVPPGTFYVRIRSANATSVSGPSNEVVVQGPGAPAPPSALSSSSTASTVTLRWSAPTTGTGPTAYVIEVGSAPGASNLAVFQVSNLTTYTAAAPPPGAYYVRVRSANARGTSAPSNEIVVRR